MLLFNHGNPPAPAGNDNLFRVSQRPYGLDFHNVNGLRRRNHAAELIIRVFPDVISFFNFRFRVFLFHVAADHLIRLIKRLIIRIHCHLGQNRADRFGNSSAQQLGPQRVLNVISHIPLAHGRTHTHGRRRVIAVDAPKLRHCLVNHADLRPVAVRNRQLVIRFHQIRQRPRSHPHRILLGTCGIAQGLMSQRYYCSFSAHFRSLSINKS